MYDAKTVIKRCEVFFIHQSKQALKVKFTAAVKHDMNELKKKCISEMKNANDISSVLPKDVTEFDHKVKMTDDKEKKFVIKHVFTDVRSAQNGVTVHGNKERHSGIPWRISLFKYDSYCHIYLECLKYQGTESWSIDTNIKVKILTTTEEEVSVNNRKFTQNTQSWENLKNQAQYNTYLVDGNLTIECHVTIKKTEGIRENRHFDESVREFSDVVLVIKNEKFYVSKLLLAFHSPYFKALLLGNFDESKQSEVELKDIEPSDFQIFLEVIYGEPAIDEDNVEELLKRADMYDAKTVIKRCEVFFIHQSKQAMMVKFAAAVKYDMDTLKKKCISEMKNANDISSVLPKDVTEFDHKVWEELLKHCICLYNKK